MKKEYQIFYYCSPLIYPIMPRDAGRSLIKLDFAAIILNHIPAQLKNFKDVDIDVEVEVFSNGESKSIKKFQIVIKDDKINPRYFEEEFSLPEYGYVQISLFAQKPYFSKIETEKGYALLLKRDHVVSTILPQSKYAEPLIIGNMQSLGTFNLVNPGHYVDSDSNISNSALIINPYDGALVAEAVSSFNKKIKRKIPGKSAVMIDLSKIVPEKTPTCVLYSGSNRYTGWDIRHEYNDVNKIINIDQLEYFRAIPTQSEKGVLSDAKKKKKKIARNFNRY